MQELKENLRKRLKDLRNIKQKQLQINQKQEIEKNLSQNLKTYINKYHQNKCPENLTIGLFYPIGSEINCLSVMQNLSPFNFNFCLPVIHEEQEEEKGLYFRSFDSQTILEKGKYNIPIPSKETSTEVIPNIILTPFLGFNQQLYRIGYGGGYYDKTIKSFQEKQIPFKFVGIGYQFQFCEDIPIEEHDQKLSAVITEQNIYEDI